MADLVRTELPAHSRGPKIGIKPLTNDYENSLASATASHVDEDQNDPEDDVRVVRCLHAVATFVQVDRVEFVAGFPDTPSDPAVVVLNPDDEITPGSFAAWLDRRQAREPVDPGVRAADTLAEARAAGEV